MNANGEVSESRTMALLKEAAITGAQERSAQVTLADIATVVTGWSEEAEAGGRWDGEAAAGMLREALEITGFIPYEPGSGHKPPRGCAQTIVNYERPGRST